MKLLISAFFCMVAGAVYAQPMDLTVYNSSNTPALLTNSFTAIGVGKGGHIWVGTSNQGIYKYNGTYWEKGGVLLDNNIGDIKTDLNGGIWVGQYGRSGAQALTGGLNYFADTTFTTVFYSASNGLPTRYVKSVYVNNSQPSAPFPYSRLWTANLGTTTGSTVTTGAVGRGGNVASPEFKKITAGVDVATDLGSVQAIGGNGAEVWAFASGNFGHSQILRYNAIDETFIQYFDDSNSPLPASFSARAIYCDNSGRVWVGMSGGNGLYVYNGTAWQQLPVGNSIFPTGTIVNANAITGSYQNNTVYIGTSAGMLVYNGGSVTDTASYKLYTAADGLPSSNVKGICIDSIGSRVLISTDNGIAFWKKQTKLAAKLAWDYSFPNPGVEPKGVVADGVSRLYLKIKKGIPDTNVIREVEITIKDTTRNNTLWGRVKKATNLTSYSDEAATGGSGSAKRNDSTTAGEYVFWYLSPEDFSRSNLGPYVALGERADTIKVKVTYRSNAKDSFETEIKIARPPLVMVHGLASGPEAWNGFKHDNGTIPFLTSPLFKYKRAFKMNGKAAFRDNAVLLLAGTDPSQKLNSLPGNIENMRKLGYAANQVDYVCHSMGGLMIRSAINWFPDKFYNHPVYQTYSKGFVHKLITINTPHNSSPVADAVTEMIPDLPEIPRSLLYVAYTYYPDEQKPFDFFVPKYPGDMLSPFEATWAIKNLSVSESNGGINLGATHVKNHLIVSDVNYEIASAAGNALIPYRRFMELLDELLDVARDKASGSAKVYLNTLYAANKVARALTFVEWYSQQKGFPAFLGDGDLIVPLQSETARQNESAPHITKFYNSADSYLDANHAAILDRKEVGQQTLLLLNSNVNGTFFADEIPANTDAARPAAARPAATPTAVSTVYDTTKVVIRTPVTAGNINVDSTLNISIRLKDTVGLAYIKVYFQGNDTATISRNAQQQFSFKVNASYPGAQTIIVQAVYDIGNDAIHHVDTTLLTVANLSTLQGFRIEEDTIEITGGTAYYPLYQAMYNGQWVNIPSNTSGITVALQSNTALNYNSYGITGLKDSTSFAYFNYGGFKDTMLFKSYMPLYSGCINKSVTSGSFKNPAIWSKGNVPGDCDSVVIVSGHTVTLDTSLTIRSLRINSGGTLSLSNNNISFTVGGKDEADHIVDNGGTLQISGGTIAVNGRMQLQNASSFAMTGGKIILDANTGLAPTSLGDGAYIFDVSSSMSSFSFTGGTLQITDPPLNAGSQAIKCSYNFGPNSTLQLGDGISTTSSNNANGFGGNQLPPVIGRFILDAGNGNTTRQFKVLSPLTIKQSATVKSGNFVQAAAVNVQQ